MLPRIDNKYFKLSYSKIVIKWVKEYYAEFGKAPRADIHTIWKNNKDTFNEDDTEEVDLLKKFLSSISEEHVESIQNNSDKFTIRQCHNFLNNRNEEILTEQMVRAKENGESIADILSNYKPYSIDIDDGSIEYTGSELLKTRFKEPIPLVPEFLMLGSCVLLIGASKIGKSWMALQLAIAISSGGKFLKWKLEKRKHVLYLANEDSELVVKERINKLKAKPEEIEKLHIMFNWKTRGVDAINRVRAYIQKNKYTRLVIIDCLGTVRGKSNNKSVYQDDYTEIERWRTLCHELGISIIIIHHPKKTIGFKANDYDMMEVVSGSNALGGCADRSMFLLRKRNEDIAKLYSFGRDGKDISLGLEWTPVEYGDGWSVKDDGDLNKLELSEASKKILAIMEDNGGPMSQIQIARIAGCSQPNISDIMPALIEKGFVKKVKVNGKNRYTYAV
jgi:predicted XRE-type DNA-binding protein